jgi:hypothetical protein
METKTQIKARKSFEFQCKQASKCRHEKFMITCFVCPELETCSIQKAVENARLKM